VPRHIGRAALFAFLITVPFTILIEPFAFLGKAWLVPAPLVAQRLLGVITYDFFLWGFLWVFCVILYAELLLGIDTSAALGARMRQFFGVLWVFAAGMLVVLALNPDALRVSYAYLWIGVIFVVPALLIAAFALPGMRRALFWSAPFFAFHALVYEFTAVSLRQWIFPGEAYLGRVELLGRAFPLEELVFYIVLGAPALLAYFLLAAGGSAGAQPRRSA